MLRLLPKRSSLLCQVISFPHVPDDSKMFITAVLAHLSVSSELQLVD